MVRAVSGGAISSSLPTSTSVGTRTPRRVSVESGRSRNTRSAPTRAGTDQRRFFAIAGDRLTLTTPPFPRSGRQVTAKLVWERMR